jgi:hypothetical protein
MKDLARAGIYMTVAAAGCVALAVFVNRLAGW